MDYAHYVLQTGALVYRWSAGKAEKFAVECLGRLMGEEGNRAAEANPTEISRAIVKLSAFSSYLDSRSNGIEDKNSLQRWRRSIWNGGLDQSSSGVEKVALSEVGPRVDEKFPAPDKDFGGLA